MKHTGSLLVPALVWSSGLSAFDVAPVVRTAPRPAIAGIASMACDQPFDELTRPKDHLRPGPIAGAWVYKASGEGPAVYLAKFRLSFDGREGVATRSTTDFQRQMIAIFVETWLPEAQVASITERNVGGRRGELATLKLRNASGGGLLYATSLAGEVFLVGSLGADAEELLASVRWAEEAKLTAENLRRQGNWCGTRR